MGPAFSWFLGHCLIIGSQCFSSADFKATYFERLQDLASERGHVDILLRSDELVTTHASNHVHFSGMMCPQALGPKRCISSLR